MRLTSAWVMCCWALIFANPATAAVAGMVVDGVKMPVWVERGATRLPAAPGMALNNGDGIVTGKGARILLKTADGALVKLGENAHMTISGLDSQPSAHFKAALNVAKGAFRFTAGILAKLRSREVTVKVANATIGVRGTDVWGKAGGNMSAAVLEKAIGTHPGAQNANEKIDFDVVCLIEGKIEVAYGPGEAFVMDQPQTVYVMPREATPLPVSPLASEQLGIWAAETEIAAGQGAARSDGKWKVNLLVAANAPDALAHYDELRSAGYPARILPLPDDQYQLRITQLPSRAEATALAQELTGKMGIVAPTVSR